MPFYSKITDEEQWNAALLITDPLTQASLAEVPEGAAESYIKHVFAGRTLKST